MFLKGAGDIEQVRIAFETMTGSAAVADKLLKDITQFAATTPFELTGLIKSSKQLLAYGFSADEIISKMTYLGNIAAGVGREKLPSIILAFGKIRTKGRATMEELNIMLEAGVPVLDALAKQMGVTKQEIIKLVSKGKVGFKEVDKALKGLGTGSGRFGGLMKKQSKSFLGIISNIKDFVTNLANAIGKDLLPLAKGLAKTFLRWLETNKQLIQVNLVKFLENFIVAAAYALGFITGIVESVIKLVQKIGQSKEGQEAMKNLEIIFFSIWDVVMKIVNAVKRVGKAFLKGIMPFVNPILNIFGKIIKEVGKIIDLFFTGEGALQGWEDIFGEIGKFVGGVILKTFKLINTILKGIRVAIVQIKALFGDKKQKALVKAWSEYALKTAPSPFAAEKTMTKGIASGMMPPGYSPQGGIIAKKGGVGGNIYQQNQMQLNLNLPKGTTQQQAKDLQNIISNTMQKWLRGARTNNPPTERGTPK